ncbi:hypothetical protein GECvBN6_gp198 [Salmonella phage GEC_vB_N6]|nr:hypothetical protein GECvBN6_gp198 [Salmonella phage GEC_vB_N6]
MKYRSLLHTECPQRCERSLVISPDLWQVKGYANRSSLGISFNPQGLYTDVSVP